MSERQGDYVLVPNPEAAKLLDPERLAIRWAVGAVLANVINYPPQVQSRLLGLDMAPLIESVTDAVLSVAGGPINWVKSAVWDEASEQFGDALQTPSDGLTQGEYRRQVIAELVRRGNPYRSQSVES